MKYLNLLILCTCIAFVSSAAFAQAPGNFRQPGNMGQPRPGDFGRYPGNPDEGQFGPRPGVDYPRPGGLGVQPRIVPADIVMPTPSEAATTTVTTTTASTATPAVSPAVSPDNFGFVCNFDKGILDYKVNDDIVFRFDLTSKIQNPPATTLYVNWTRTGDDGQIANGKNEITMDKPLGLSTKMNRPGFVHLEAKLEDANGRRIASFNGGAGVDLPNIKAAAKEPEDFDEYWQKELSALDEIPVFAEVKRVSKDDSDVNVYAVSIPCTGPRPATGYMSIPAKAKPVSLPAELHLQAYGMRIPTIPTNPPKDKIYFDLNAHGLELVDPSSSYYSNFSRSLGHYGYDIKQNSDRDTAYFKYMLLRVVRTCQYIEGLPQWNRKDFKVWGYSQGGLQTMWAAALVPGISQADAGMPWSCNLGGAAIDKRLKGTCPEYTDALNYYDPVFFAKRVPSTCLMNFIRTGLGDYVSPPSSVTAVYNNVPGPKKITYYQGIGHEEPKPDSQAYMIDATKIQPAKP